MSRDQLDRVGAVLAAHMDMVKGFMGDQFAVSIVCRNKTGPFHLLLGEDTELVLIGALSELQRIGVGLIRDGQPVVEPELSVADHMFNLLQEVAEESRNWTDGDLADFRLRVREVLAMAPPGAGTPATEAAEHYEAVLSGPPLVTVPPEGLVTADLQLTEVHPCPIPPPRVCPRCAGPMFPGMDRCTDCGDLVNDRTRS